MLLLVGLVEDSAMEKMPKEPEYRTNAEPCHMSQKECHEAKPTYWKVISQPNVSLQIALVITRETRPKALNAYFPRGIQTVQSRAYSYTSKP